MRPETAEEMFQRACSEFRGDIKLIGSKVMLLKQAINKNSDVYSDKCDVPEMIANVMLSYRHLEDAAMRLGKAIQASEEGISIYDQNDAKRVTGGSVEPVDNPVIEDDEEDVVE